jgi:hypothetical protein
VSQFESPLSNQTGHSTFLLFRDRFAGEVSCHLGTRSPTVEVSAAAPPTLDEAEALALETIGSLGAVRSGSAPAGSTLIDVQ